MPPKQKTAIPSITSSALLRDLEEMELGSSQMSGLESLNGPIIQPNVITNREPDGEQTFPIPVRSMSFPHDNGTQHRPEQNQLMLSRQSSAFDLGYVESQPRQRDLKFKAKKGGFLNKLEGTGAGRKATLKAIKDVVGEINGVTYVFDKTKLQTLQGTGVKEELATKQVREEFAVFKSETQFSKRSRGVPDGPILAADLWPPMSCWLWIQSRVLKAALYSAVMKGCKICTGFGHSAAKCITAVRLKHFGRGVKVMREAYKEALAQIPTSGLIQTDSSWILIQAVAQQFDEGIVTSRKDTRTGAKERLLRLQYYRESSVDQLSAMASRRCNVCMGWGHISTDNVRPEPTEAKQKMICPAVVELDKKIECDMLAKQEWIKVKEEIGQHDDQFKNPYLHGERVVDAINFEVEKINLHGKTLKASAATVEEWWTSYYQTVYTAFACAASAQDTYFRVSQQGQGSTDVVDEIDQILANETWTIAHECVGHLDDLRSMHTNGILEIKSAGVTGVAIVKDLFDTQNAAKQAANDRKLPKSSILAAELLQNMEDRVEAYLKKKESCEGIVPDLMTRFKKIASGRMARVMRKRKDDWYQYTLDTEIYDKPGSIIDTPFESAEVKQKRIADEVKAAQLKQQPSREEDDAMDLI